ncbi:PilT protein domain protein [Halorubrum californiense DSM 19288]|uniref:PilT protein domain protein n=1 Tax=Halorubrum californiense DSM 19288 TaxID=1227465 RepID=M0E0G6_9EURY|nr:MULTISPECIES: type II toxin-antitoxin system VapC family toxin [Halorubrum]ELZ41266.1 PilT protein domain protein [Halorubrum californiense DSM 19288]TKX72709.1 type II toxin-antitoxin system VapC family toxin [Halorubrum sp. GN11GM_10-3_MGM]
MILDSSFLIDLMNGDDAAMEAAREIEERSVPQRVPAQVVYELYVGVGYSESASREVETIQSVLESRPIIDLTEDVAKHAGRIDGRLRREGSRTGQGGIKIAAAAIRHDEPVITGDPADFDRIPDVEVREY